MFVKKRIYIFIVKYLYSCKGELHSKKRMFMPAPSIERKLSVEKKGNQFNRDDTVWHFPMILG